MMGHLIICGGCNNGCRAEESIVNHVENGCEHHDERQSFYILMHQRQSYGLHVKIYFANFYIYQNFLLRIYKIIYF